MAKSKEDVLSPFLSLSLSLSHLSSPSLSLSLSRSLSFCVFLTQWFPLALVSSLKYLCSLGCQVNAGMSGDPNHEFHGGGEVYSVYNRGSQFEQQ